MPLVWGLQVRQGTVITLHAIGLWVLSYYIPTISDIDTTVQVAFTHQPIRSPIYWYHTK